MQNISFPVLDIHCDLLSYLEKSSHRTALDPQSRASLLHMQEGNVFAQVLAIFTSGKGQDQLKMQTQAVIFKNIFINHSRKARPLSSNLQPDKNDQRVQFFLALENCAGLCLEADSVVHALKQLNNFKKNLGPIAYIALTWDGENRYGGGVGSKVGLKSDGKVLIEWMNENRVPLDLSHASDYLIDDIFNFLDKKSINLPIIASHSNFRSITNMERNLPDEFAKEIGKRCGLIGINFFRHFSGGKTPHGILEHIRYGIELGLDENMCLGADFFEDADAEYIKAKYGSEKCFYEELGNSGCYPYFFDFIKNNMNIKDDFLKKIASENAQKFFAKTFAKQVT